MANGTGNTGASARARPFLALTPLLLAGIVLSVLIAVRPGPGFAQAVIWPTLTGGPPVVIAHRGASGLRPEHTLEAYDLAIDQGADWIEPDLVVTRDHILVCRHDRYLSTTTDVRDRPEFADREVTKTVNGVARTDWWAEDFTLAELKTLRARQPFEGRSRDFDGRFKIPTFDEVIALAKSRSTKERIIGVIPETKQPGALTALGHDVAGLLVDALTRADWTSARSPVIVQSFEPDLLKTLMTRLSVRRAQLVFAVPNDTGGARSNIPLEDLFMYATAVGAQKLLTVDRSGRPSTFVERAHALGMPVFAWTYRDDVPPADKVDPKRELERAFRLGIDGVFTDFPATAVDVRRRLVSERR
ncbi:MAG: glycerophosphodiester phosphodiesterase family protein [Alphaproteobacteria bacterium]